MQLRQLHRSTSPAWPPSTRPGKRYLPREPATAQACKRILSSHTDVAPKQTPVPLPHAGLLEKQGCLDNVAKSQQKLRTVFIIMQRACVSPGWTPGGFFTARDDLSGSPSAPSSPPRSKHRRVNSLGTHFTCAPLSLFA